jgi:hypothetical protein
MLVHKVHLVHILLTKMDQEGQAAPMALELVASLAAAVADRQEAIVQVYLMT